MAYSKTKKILFILLCLLVILFPFWCVKGLCADETSGTIVNHLMSSNGVFVDTTSESYCLVFNLIPEHNYRLNLKGEVSPRTILKSQEFPSDRCIL